MIWRIKLYPKGNASSKNEYLSIFLELLEGINEISKYYYILELINFKNKNNFYQEYSSNFSNGECWGYSKFFKLSKLKENGFIDDKGKICIKIHIRPENYFQLSRDLKNYINKLEYKIKYNVNDENNFSSDIDNEDTFNCSFEKKFKDLNMVKSFLINEEEKKININNKNFIESTKKKILDNILKSKTQKFIISNENSFHLFQNNQNIESSNRENKIITRNNIYNNKISLTEQNLIYKKKYNNLTNKLSDPLSQRSNKINENEIQEKNRLKIDLSFNSNEEENEIRKLENLKDPKYIIPKENENQSILSEDSIINLMNSIKTIDEKKDVKNNRNNNNLDYYNLENKKEVKNNYFGKYYGLHSLSNSNSTTFKNNNNYFYGNQFDNYKQKYNLK